MMILEVPCGNIESVLSAKLGGADRIELCSALPLGGLTPSLEMLEAIKGLGIPVFVMVRPREGDFIYSPEEFRMMLRTIEHFKSAGANGIVSGILLKNGRIDMDRSRELIEASRPLPFTFHRAFDLTSDPYRSLDILIELKADRILTSGQSPDAWTGRQLISRLVERAENKIVIMAGAGINPENVASICDETGVNEIHLSGKIKKINDGNLNQSSVFIGKPGSDESVYDVTDSTIIKMVRTIIDKKSYE